MQINLKSAQVALKDLEEPLDLSQPGVSKWVSTNSIGTTRSKRDQRVTLASLLDVLVTLRRRGTSEDAESARLRKLMAEADMAELERDQLAGTLVDALEIKALYSDFLARLRTNIRGLPDRMVPRLEEGGTLPERLAIAKTMVDDLLRDVVAEEEKRG